MEFADQNRWDALDEEWETIGNGSDTDNETDIMSSQDHTYAQPASLERSYSEDFTCGVCYELMVEPTTLQCGHSFCRLCLANWYLESNRQECPTCRQGFIGIPRVSVTLRSTISSLMGARYEARKQLLTPQSYAVITEFERRLQSSAVQTTQQRILRPIPMARAQNQNAANMRDPKVWLGFAIISIAAIVIWTILSWLLFGGIDSEPAIRKPMARWTEAEVSQWLTDLGWAKEALGETFATMKVDGSLLVAMTEDDLEFLASDLDDLHKRAFLLSRDANIERGSKPPGDFWEYKKLHLFKTTWGVVFMQNFPRFSMVLLYFFDYEASFLPIIHTVCPVLNMELVSLYSSKLPSPTWGQWLDFSFRWLFVPYLGVYMDFLFRVTWHSNTWMTLYACASLLMLSVVEWLNALVFIRMSATTIKDIAPSYIKNWLWASFFQLCMYSLWNFIPSIIVNVWFYFNFLVAPYNYSRARDIWRTNEMH